MASKAVLRVSSLAVSLCLLAGGAAATSSAALAATCALPTFSVDVSAFLAPYPDSVNSGAEGIDNAGGIPFPMTEPYSTDGTTVLRGGEGRSITSTAGVADWVVVELRDVNDAASIIATDAVVLRSDNGKNVTPAQFTVPPGTYRVAITHRNHLTVMAETPIVLGSGSTPTVDFTDPGTPMYNEDPTKAGNERNDPFAVPSGATRLQLVAGDYNRDGVVDSTDFALMQQALLGTTVGYIPEDVSLDGYVDSTDFGMISYAIRRGFGEGSVPKGALAPAPVFESPTITSAAPANPTSGLAYQHAVTTAGTAPVTLSLASGGLPPGLSFDASTGVISGTTTATGDFSFQVQATNSCGTDARTYVMSLAASAPAPSPSASTAAAPTSTASASPSAIPAQAASRGHLAVTGGRGPEQALSLVVSGGLLAAAGVAFTLFSARRRRTHR